MKKFCADDWGMSPSINDAILDLIENKLIYSVSIIIGGKYVDYRLRELLLLQKTNEVKLSLHFNLTYKHEFRSPIQVLIAYALRRINYSSVRKELLNQIKIAESKEIHFDMIDGHHHIHLLPFVFKVINQNVDKININAIRVMNDILHFTSYSVSLMVSILFKKELKNWILIDCGYLLASDLKSNESIASKTKKFERLIIHPAKYYDFDKVDFSDSLKEQRILEFQKIMEYCH